MAGWVHKNTVFPMLGLCFACIRFPMPCMVCCLPSAADPLGIASALSACSVPRCPDVAVHTVPLLCSPFPGNSRGLNGILS
ncbi:hypothetical protein COCSUDRAFT_33446 [Coccomyxa subellipsoidea C-169]|uniref:Secreted protein n=1 Tax=Coccomyxa subellipsoidea (strain C-169) TaxID=574566 RepID=I0YUV0_COCSC|nr:hypothetical protein COCSUDRAFT_33446 [Coccomyxa subellipsoidea C-169]EIE22169.1 hypothetical protein COCSUDRAFT_33446 [Coccomyxa subellipsoidea C-169]|eukprot:XP_005646713.1 hypothetical protein COCSUDRAFT_33446 [Coccomyxa subellipsoidea C-169]